MLTLCVTQKSIRNMGYFLVILCLTTITVFKTEASTTQPRNSDFAIYGELGVMVQKDATINGGYLASATSVILADAVTLTNHTTTMATNIELRGSTTIHDAYYDSVNKPDTVLGQHGDYPNTKIFDWSALPTVSLGQQDIAIPTATHTQLDAGAYGNLTIAAGSTLVLTGGTYHFNTINLADNASLRFAAPTDLRVAKNLYVGRYSHVSPLENTALRATDIEIYVFGTDATMTNSLAVAHFSRQNQVTATVYAPNGQIIAGREGQFKGAFRARWVYVDIASSVTFDGEITSVATSPAPPPAPIESDVFYVSRHGDNSDGRTWASAWNELAAIDWTQIQPGHTIYIDGGTSGMLYQTELTIGASGTADNPIRILRSTEPYHAGEVTFFGGRSNALPYCGQTDYVTQAEESLIPFGIRTNDHKHIVIDGQSWHGIEIKGYGRNGIRIDRHSENITIRNIRIRNNGSATKTSNGWQSDEPGVRLGGRNITLQRLVIHDNGADAIQSMWDDNNIENFRLEQSWLYNQRKHPVVTDEAFNYCTHTDGIQIYDGGHITGITLTESIIGPGFTQGVLLGQSATDGLWAEVDNVVMRDVLFTKSADNNIVGYRNTDTDNWTLERITAHCPITKGHCLRIDNANHVVVDSVIVGGAVTFEDGLNTYSGNCQWQTDGGSFILGEEINPYFTKVNEFNNFSIDDYGVNNTQCVGSRITSVEDLYTLD